MYKLISIIFFILICILVIMFVHLYLIVAEISVEIKEHKDLAHEFTHVVELLPEKPEPVKISDEEFELVYRVVAAEARGTDQQAMIAICNVIQNRARLRNMSLEQVLTEPEQFAPPYTGKISEEVSGAVNKALLHGAKIVPDDTEYFHAHYVRPEWADRFTEVYRDDWHVFYADRREK